MPALFKLLLATIDVGGAAIRTRNGRPIVRRRARGGHDVGEVVVLAAVVASCADRVREACGIELISVVITGDALTDGYLLADAIAGRGTTHAVDADVNAWVGAVAVLRSV